MMRAHVLQLASLERNDSESKGAYRIALCRGMSACPFGLIALEPLRTAIETAIDTSPWSTHFDSTHLNRSRPHDRLRIALSACPNGCSQPHIQDIGLIAALRPREITATCTGCGLCEKTCREAAIHVQGGLAVTRPQTCLACGECAKICPARAVRCEPLGFRLLLGGRMGRHPAWATELPGLYTQDQIPGIFRRLLQVLLRETRLGERPGQVLTRLGIKQVEQELGACAYD